MDWDTIGFIALGVTIISQLVIWWVDRKDPRKLKWLRRLIKRFPMRASEQRFLETYEKELRDFARPGLCGTVRSKAAQTPLDTRVGGPLIVPKGSKMPTNALGRPLLPLLVIRLSDLPEAHGNVLPADGWIQVLVEAYDFWDVPMPISQGASFRVIHYAQGTEFDVHPVDPLVAKEHAAWDSMDNVPELFSAGLSIDFEPVLSSVPFNHYKLSDLTARFTTKAFDDAFDALHDALEDETPRCDVMIGGHAAFTQEDIRYQERYAGFENLIRMSGTGSVFSWGDAGEAPIMVPEKDLASGRLQNAIFYFDFH